MTDFSSIRVLNFSGRKEEWPSWSEKFLAKAKRSGTKDVLLGKVEIPSSFEVADENTEEGKKLLRIRELNEIAYTELILSIDVSNSQGKIAFGIVKSCKTKEFEDGNAALAWEKLRKKFDPVSAPSLVKTERMFRDSRLGKNEDPDVWINSLEDLRVKLEVMGSSMTDDQFMIQVLNSLTGDYELQILLLEKRIGNIENPLSIEELKEELSLRFERLSTKQNEDSGEENALFTTQFKGKCRNCGKLGHKAAQCKLKPGKQEKNDVFCSYCKRPGHVKANCFKLMKKNLNFGGTENGVAGTADVLLSTMTKVEEFQNDIWIGDSGASCHYCNDDKFLFDYTMISEEITVGNGNVMLAKKMGKLRCEILQKNGEKLIVTLQDVKYVPDLWVNLFSIGKALKNGFNLGNDGERIKLMKGSVIILFDRFITSKNGSVPVIKMKPLLNAVSATSVESRKGKSKNTIEINDLHQILGHCGEASARLTGKALGYEVIGTFDTCEACSIGKARQKNVNKDWKGGSLIAGERLYVDISSIQGVSFGGSKFWALIVDDYSGYCWSYFMKTKSELKERVIDLIKELRNVKYLRLDDAGENFALEKLCKQQNLQVKFEFSGPRTPQRNGKVERKFQTLYGRIRAMMNSAGIEGDFRKGLWAECASTATFYENIIVNREKKKSPFELMFKSKGKELKSLKRFGEMCVVTTKAKIQGKLNDRGTACVFVGYPKDHSNDVYRLLNPETNQIINSRDIIWLNKTYGQWMKSKDSLEKVEDDSSDSELDIVATKEQMEAPAKMDDTAKNAKVLKEISKLKSWFNPDPSRFIEEQDPGRDLIVEKADVALNAVELVEEPKTFEEAYYHPDSDLKMKWQEAISKEFEEMSAKRVWKKIRKSELPNGRTCIKSKWVFKIKRNGVFRARLVACGYSQVPGVDFQESFAPVINDVTFRILLITMLTWKLTAKVVDIETAFLHGDLKETIYMEIPKGMKAEDNECLILNKTIYGLVQSAREFYNKLVSALKDCGFKASSVDPCLWIKYSNHGIVLIAIYVDDCLMVGREPDIDDVIEKLKNYDFGLKVEHNLTDYLSCRIFVNYENNVTFVMQPHLIKNLEDKFGEEVNNLSNYGTPGTPRFKIVRPNDDVEKIDSKLQARYRSGVGMLLFLIKYSRPDLANVVRELSKCMDGASHAAYKEMLRVMKFVLDTKEYCLKLQPINETKNWNLVSYCDSDWAGDAETRISVTGFIIYLLGVPICWRSKGQKSVTLSSSEAEYIAISEAVKEIRFIYYLLDSIGIKVELPIVVRCDNVGAIFMAENSSSGVRTRHIDTRYHFIREHIEDGFIKIVFVRSCENVGDIFTKNVNKEIYDKHVSKFLGKVKDDSDG